MEKFVILADALSGARYFNSIIDQHPGIRCFNEIFSHFDPDHFFPFLMEKIREDPMNVIPTRWPDVFDDYLSTVYSHSHVTDNMAVGAGIRYYQTSWVFNIFGMLKKHQVKVIHLGRKNILKHHIALLLHTQRDYLGRCVHDTRNARPAELLPVKLLIDPKTLIPALRNRLEISKRYGQLLSGSDLAHIDIYYEDCFDNPELISQTMTPFVFDQVYDFLDIDNRRYDLKTRHVTGNPGLLCDLVENYHELVDFLTGTEWEYLLNDSIGRNIETAEDLNRHGESLATSGRKKEALDVFLKAAKIEPNFAPGYNNIGVILYEDGSIHESLRYFEKAIDIDRNQMYIDNYNGVLAVIDGENHPRLSDDAPQRERNDR